MKLFRVTIKGMSPYLMHRFQDGALEGNGTRRVNIEANQPAPRDEAERFAYRFKDRSLYFPGAAIGRLLREAGGNHKLKGSRKSLKFIVPSSVLVLDDAIPFHNGKPANKLTEFEVDSRPVTIPATKGRVMRHRPRLEEWAATFNLRINEQLLSPDSVLMLLNEGGQQLGIGDFRPERGGPFGTFAVTSWEEQ